MKNKKRIWVAKLSLLFICIFYLFFKSFYVALPQKKAPIQFYHNDFALLFARAIKQAKTVVLTSFGLDQTLKSVLQKKPCTLFLDATQSNTILNKTSFFLNQSGFFHPKILLLDDARVLIGTANLTKNSLFFAANFCVGLYSPHLNAKLKEALFTQQALHYQENALDFFYKAPDALEFLLQFLASTKTHLKIAMYTLTHPKIIECLIALKNRGVFVEIFLDKHPANRPTIETLKKEKICVHMRTKPGMLHTKLAIKDHKALYIGSANWTRRGFSKNHEVLLFLHHLTNSQKDQVFMHFKML
ncbi:MAG: Cardiolipin synthase [Chlamydiae bacterium]|nr:Cardiolipin synthase [Chlamydiota bacterium]